MYLINALINFVPITLIITF